MSAIKDINLAPSGAHKIDWVRKNCPLLRSLEDDFSKERPFEGIRIALSIHLEANRISVQGTGSRRCGNVYHRK